MSLKLLQYSNDDFDKWETFIDNSQNGTLFDKISFINYHDKNKFNQKQFFLVNENNSTIAVLLSAIEIDPLGNKQLTSPFGASIGGPVFFNDAKYNDFEEVIIFIIDYCKINDIRSIKFRVAPDIYYSQSNNYLSFVLFKLGFRIFCSHLTFLVNLKDNFIQKIPERKLRYIKQTIEKNNLEVRKCDISHLDIFYDMLLENRKKFNAVPTHSYQDLFYLITNCHDSVKLYLAYSMNEPISGGLIFELNSKVAYLFYLCHYEKFETIRASLYITYQLQEIYSYLGFQYFDYGSSSSDDLTVNKGVLKFKEELGATGFMRNSWILNL